MSKKLIHILLKLKQSLTFQTIPVVAGIWEEEQSFLSAVKAFKKENYKNFSTITPCPIHGLEELLEIKRSWIPWITFVFCTTGGLFGLWLTWWTSVVNWPLIIGGKPMWSLPAFIPIIFECTILFGALASVGALLYACRIPSIDPPILDKDLSSHKFAIYFSLQNKTKPTADIEKMLTSLGATRIVHSEF